MSFYNISFLWMAMRPIGFTEGNLFLSIPMNDNQRYNEIRYFNFNRRGT